MDTDCLGDFSYILKVGFVGVETDTGTVNKNNASHKMESSEKKFGRVEQVRYVQDVSITESRRGISRLDERVWTFRTYPNGTSVGNYRTEVGDRRRDAKAVW
jgi:hypothetical protein